jgi:uncharacterized membrane protein
MAAAARKLSQVITHMAIGFTITYAVTGSAVFGGVAVLLEPVINVMLVPFHERAWTRFGGQSVYRIAAEKLSLAGMHMVVAFGTMFAVTGSMAVGGLAAVLEPICNVILMPLHDRFWNSMRLGVSPAL